MRGYTPVGAAEGGQGRARCSPPRSRRCRSASRWRAIRSTPTSRTRTRGTRTWRACGSARCIASRSSSPSTAWSRCGRGRPISSAAAISCRRGSRRRRWRAADRVIAVSAQDARRHPRALSTRIPARSSSSTTASIPTASAGRSARDHLERLGVKPPYVLFVGPHHGSEGDLPSARGGADAAARRAGRAVRVGAGHAGDRGAPAQGRAAGTRT